MTLASSSWCNHAMRFESPTSTIPHIRVLMITKVSFILLVHSVALSKYDTMHSTTDISNISGGCFFAIAPVTGTW